MQIKQLFSLCLFAILSHMAVYALGNADDVVGVWLTEDGDAKIEIYNCGDKTYCGKIVWLLEPNDSNGDPKTDQNNPDSAKHGQAILGMEMMKNFVYDGEKYYNEGSIYDAKEGKAYDGYVTMQEDGSLYLKGGYKVFGMMVGKSSTWTRAK